MTQLQPQDGVYYDTITTARPDRIIRIINHLDAQDKVAISITNDAEGYEHESTVICSQGQSCSYIVRFLIASGYSFSYQYIKYKQKEQQS